MGTFFLLIIIVIICYFIFKRNSRNLAPLDISHLPKQFVVFDLETTGLDASKNQIIEIGAIRVNRDSNQHDTYQNLILIKRRLPKKIVELTGITDELLKSDGVSLNEAIQGFSDFVGNLHLISFNTDFDLAFLHNAAKECNLHFNNPTSCALKMARKAWPGRKSFRLTDLSRDGNLSLKNEHRALGDCERALLVYIAAASKLQTV